MSIVQCYAGCALREREERLCNFVRVKMQFESLLVESRALLLQGRQKSPVKSQLRRAAPPELPESANWLEIAEARLATAVPAVGSDNKHPRKKHTKHCFAQYVTLACSNTAFATLEEKKAQGWQLLALT
eukprot:4861493-Pyramimonas_sp.AAC.1